MIPFPSHPGIGQSLRSLKGIGPQIEEALAKKGYQTLGDLLSLMPVRYQDRRTVTPIDQLTADAEVMIRGTIVDMRQGQFPKTFKKYFEITVEDETGRINALWFSAPAHMRHTLNKGQRLVMFGKVGVYRKHLQFVHPEILADAPDSHVPEIRPVYPEIESVKPGVLRRIMLNVRAELNAIPTFFPSAWLAEHKLADPVTSLKTLHMPPADRTGALPRPEQSRAWKSLALFELLFLQLMLARSRARQALEKGRAFPEKSEMVGRFLSGLPFGLTDAQQKALDEIRKDMSRPAPMNRLLQGDVGCGKTVVAVAAALTAVDGGRQTAIMAPTEILARQHFEEIKPHAERLGIRADLLIGSMPETDKKRKREDVASGKTRIIIGTQALISAGLDFQSLGLAVIDEQHRFGVGQRLALRSKAEHPDILVMTATPIPRSLAMTLYGDLDLSVIDRLPPGRTPVRTRVFAPADRDQAYALLRGEVEAGGKAYVVAPRIEARDDDESDGDDLAAVESLYEFVQREVVTDGKVGLVHGRMKTEDQQAVMERFRDGDLNILVATTVIEVGVDVPDAVAILIEGADRFGLAQLHQLRGRVGRGGKPGICLLVAEQDGRENSARLSVMERTSDGFVLAEEDLKLRGPGDAFGRKQSGLPPFTWARLPRDLPLLLKAKSLAGDIVRDDPEITGSAFKLVRQMVDELEKKVQSELADVG